MSSDAGAIERFQPPGAAKRLGGNMEISVTKLQLPWLHWCASMSQSLAYPQLPEPEMRNRACPEVHNHTRSTHPFPSADFATCCTP